MPKRAKTPVFYDLLDSHKGEEYLESVFGSVSRKELFERWYSETGEFGEIYPSQGLLSTPFDFLEMLGKTLLSEEELWETILMRRYVLEMFNHPERIEALRLVEKGKFAGPPEVENEVMDFAVGSGMSLAVRDLGSVVVDTENSRVRRRKLLSCGPFLKLGKHARVPFASGAMPDVFGSPASLATLAMCHGLAGIPRNGAFSEVKRQADLAKAAVGWLKSEPLLEGRKDAGELLKVWKRNLVGVIEPEQRGGMERTEALYRAGVRSFRVYSPEPGVDALATVKALRRSFGSRVEIFVGQVVSVAQGMKLEEAGADGLYVGIGGGGRCITAVRSGSVVGWPNLLWQMRGRVGVPVLVEGGASDHVGVTLLLGGSGIGVSRSAAGGTIESPGGLMYWVGEDGKWFKPYGGEASARTKYLDKKVLARGLPAFVEGETTKALKSYVPYARPTVAENMYFLIEDLILSLVFRGVETVEELQALSPSPLRRVTQGGSEQQEAH